MSNLAAPLRPRGDRTNPTPKESHDAHRNYRPASQRPAYPAGVGGQRARWSHRGRSDRTLWPRCPRGRDPNGGGQYRRAAVVIPTVTRRLSPRPGPPRPAPPGSCRGIGGLADRVTVLMNDVVAVVDQGNPGMMYSCVDGCKPMVQHRVTRGTTGGAWSWRHPTRERWRGSMRVCSAGRSRRRSRNTPSSGRRTAWPVWPPADGRQQMMMHLDFEVSDLDAAVSHALELGAHEAEHQPQDNVRVLVDPAGHPFCLYVDK